jgi:ribonuclease HI
MTSADKSFPTEQEARDFVAGKDKPTSSKPTGDKFYAVAVGHRPGVYEEWVEAQEQITGVKGPKYKKFATRAEAEEFVRTLGKSSTVAAPKRKETDVEEPTSKKARTSTESAPVDTSKSKMIRIYTDGSSRGNGKHGAYAGVGVFFGDGDARQVFPLSILICGC